MSRSRRPSLLSVLAVAVVVALSVGAAWAVRHAVQRQDETLLKAQTAEAALRLEENAERISLGLGSVGVEHTVFEKQAAAILTRPTDTVALVSKGHVIPNTRGTIAPGPPEVAVAVGPALQDGQPLPPELTQIALTAGPTLSASPVIQLAGHHYVVFSIVPPSIGLPGYVALQLNDIGSGHTANALDVGVDQLTAPGAAFDQLDFALYATPTPQPGELLATTTGGDALPQPTTSTAVKVGNLDWDLVGAARTPLLDRTTRATPWIVLGVGLLLALGTAITVETLLRRQREQRTVAETLQAALLPDTLPQSRTIEAAVRYLAGVEGIHVGGDWYDLIVLDDTHLLAVVGDVSGRGLEAAAIMGSLLYATRAYAAEGHSPDTILAKLSALSGATGDHFATVLMVLIDHDEQTITIANAGHPPPLVLRDHHAEYLTSPIGPPIGVFPDATYTPVTVPISPGSTLLAYTDGLIERRGETLDVGLERLRDAATRYDDDSLDALLSIVVDSLVRHGSADDTVLLGLRWRATPVAVDVPSASLTPA